MPVESDTGRVVKDPDELRRALVTLGALGLTHIGAFISGLVTFEALDRLGSNVPPANLIIGRQVDVEGFSVRFDVLREQARENITRLLGKDINLALILEACVDVLGLYIQKAARDELTPEESDQLAILAIGFGELAQELFESPEPEPNLGEA